jgi:hypothetical protein
MEFLKYQHVERLYTRNVQGILEGECHIFPKIDGTNASLWYDDGLQAGSRNRQLTLDNDNGGFYKWASEQDNLVNFFNANPNLRLYGEWLIPHSLKTYKDEAWRQFYVFDVVFDGAGDDDKVEYLPYYEYSRILDDFDINYIEPISIISNPTDDDIKNCLDINTYLIKDGNGVGEGIVIKNYTYKTKYEDVHWAKVVTSEFRKKHAKEMGGMLNAPTDSVESKIIDKYLTEALVQKNKAKIENENDGFFESKKIPELLERVFYDLINEDCWNFVKKYKYPIIDFAKLKRDSILAIKEIVPELF